MPETESEKRKAYLEERKLLIELERSGSESFDKTITTLSAGALGLSITFIHEIAPTPRGETIWLMIVAWSGFGLALLVTLFSFLLSQSAMRKQRELLDEDYKGIQNPEGRPSWTAKVTNILNWSSIVFFTVGVISLATFTVENLPEKEKPMADKPDKATTSIEKKGIVPPMPPVKEAPKPKQSGGIVPPGLPAKPSEPSQNPGGGKKQ
jgi:hypothetical protein